jgi:hypothetical protein
MNLDAVKGKRRLREGAEIFRPSYIVRLIFVLILYVSL